MKTFLTRIAIFALSAALAACAANSLHREGLADVERGEYESGVRKLSEAVAKDPGNLSFKLDLAARRDAALQKLIATARGPTGSWTRRRRLTGGCLPSSPPISVRCTASKGCRRTAATPSW